MLHAATNTTLPQAGAVTADLSTYRCAIRAYQQACDIDTALDTFIQLKAPNATEALRLARLVTPAECVVVDAERLDG